MHKIERDLTEQFGVTDGTLTVKNDGKVGAPEQKATEFAEGFVWNEGKFQIKSSLREITEEIQKEVLKTDTTAKDLLQKYNSIKSQLGQLERKGTGNLMVRSLTGIVKKENTVDSMYSTQLGSSHDKENEMMANVYVVVNRNNEKEWLGNGLDIQGYEQFADCPFTDKGAKSSVPGVVPKSAHTPIHEDGDLRLYSPIVFRKCLDEFKQACREKRFTVRDFTFEETAAKDGDDEKQRLLSEKDRVHGDTQRRLQTAWKVVYANWMHLKATRMFVESVLRYGLPPNFQIMVIQPNKGKAEKCRKLLGELYKTLGNAMALGNDDGGGEEAFYPYVCLNLKTSATTAEV